MRILITNKGNIIIQDIDEAPQTLLFPNKFNNPQNQAVPPINIHHSRGYSTGSFMINPKKIGLARDGSKTSQASNLFREISLNNSINIFQTKTQKNLKFVSSNTSRLELEDREITKEEIKNAKKIIINKKKFSFPPSFVEKYESNNIPNLINSNSSRKSDIGSNKQINTEGLSTGGLVRKEKLLSFDEIIPNQTVYDMKKQIYTNRRIREKATKITNNDFRSIYETENDLRKFSNILSYPLINSKKSSLIKYFNEKKKIEPLTIKSIFNRNSEKINKLNKLCQIFYQNEDKEKLFNDLIKNKIKQNINTTKKSFQNQINIMGDEMETTKEKLDKYNIKINNREKYREQFNEIVKHYWAKNNFERFNKKNTPKDKYLSSYIDSES